MCVIDCKKISDEFSEIIRERISTVTQSAEIPYIHFVVGDEENSDTKFVQHKHVFAEKMGLKSEIHKLPPQTSENEFAELIAKLNADNEVHAISLQNHLPKKLCFRNLVNLVSVDKDVEGLTTLNQGRLFSGEPGIVPCVPLGILHILRQIHENLEGMHAVIIGRSSAVGRPLTQLLLNANCTVTLLHSYSRDLPQICKTADILVCAVGKPNFITEECVKPGATVIDVGLNEVLENGVKKTVGDVDFDAVKNIADGITSVGGVELMSLTYLIHNALKLACCY